MECQQKHNLPVIVSNHSRISPHVYELEIMEKKEKANDRRVHRITALSFTGLNGVILREKIKGQKA